MFIYDHSANVDGNQKLKSALIQSTYVKGIVPILDRHQIKRKVMISAAKEADRSVVSEIFMLFQCVAYFEQSKKMVSDMPKRVIKRIVAKYHIYSSTSPYSYKNFKIFIKKALRGFMMLYGGFSAHVPNIAHDAGFGFDVSIIHTSVKKNEHAHPECRVRMFGDFYISNPECNVLTSSPVCSIHTPLYSWVFGRYMSLLAHVKKKTKSRLMVSAF